MDESGGVRQISLPADARSQSRLARIDYTDAFLVNTSGLAPMSAERWARTILEGAPRYFTSSAPTAWRALGLERGPVSSSTSILSWPIVNTSEDAVLLGASGRLGMSGELLIMLRADGLLFSTMIELRTRAVRIEWAAITPAHQRIVRRLLLRAGGVARRGAGR